MVVDPAFTTALFIVVAFFITFIAATFITMGTVVFTLLGRAFSQGLKECREERKKTIAAQRR